MKPNSTFAVVRTFASFLLLSFTCHVALADFCWRDSYPRGIGGIPKLCAQGKENDAALCYPQCNNNMQGVGPVCWGRCPGGFTDAGVSCTKPAAYGRGGGYPWKFGDGLNDDGMYKRCQGDNGNGNCEKWGAVVYPKCKSGFHAVGCCVCSPDCPSGFSDNGVGCQKPSYGRGAGTVPETCSSDSTNSGGLCYQNCPVAFNNGVGPVCWKACQGASPFPCGGGCAKNQLECQVNMVEQAMALVEFVTEWEMKVESGGVSESFKEWGAGGKELYIATLKAAIKGSAISDTTTTNVQNTIKQAWPNATPAQQQLLTKILSGQDFDLAQLDPTGLISLGRTFAAPVCGK